MNSGTYALSVWTLEVVHGANINGQVIILFWSYDTSCMCRVPGQKQLSS